MKDTLSSSRRWLALGVVCLGVVMVVLDVTIVNVALPSIRSLGAAARRFDHGAGEIDAEQAARGTDAPRRRERDQPRAAGDVEDTLAGSKRDTRQHRPLHAPSRVS